jgi:hypothetical protein
MRLICFGVSPVRKATSSCNNPDSSRAERNTAPNRRCNANSSGVGSAPLRAVIVLHRAVTRGLPAGFSRLSIQLAAIVDAWVEETRLNVGHRGCVTDVKRA